METRARLHSVAARVSRARDGGVQLTRGALANSNCRRFLLLFCSLVLVRFLVVAFWLVKLLARTLQLALQLTVALGG